MEKHGKFLTGTKDFQKVASTGDFLNGNSFWLQKHFKPEVNINYNNLTVHFYMAYIFHLLL